MQFSIATMCLNIKLEKLMALLYGTTWNMILTLVANEYKLLRFF